MPDTQSMIIPLAIPGIYEITPQRFHDTRGFFSETYQADQLAAHNIRCKFIQDNHSYSQASGTMRGLHYQLPPFAQTKLIRVLRGRIYDVAVDIRRSSPTFLAHVGLELSADRWNQLLIPQGFAHGFMTLECDTEVLYKVDAAYSPQHEGSIRYDDAELAIQWPFNAEQILLSEKDQAAPALSEARLFD